MTTNDATLSTTAAELISLLTAQYQGKSDIQRFFHKLYRATLAARGQGESLERLEDKNPISATHDATLNTTAAELISLLTAQYQGKSDIQHFFHKLYRATLAARGQGESLERLEDKNPISATHDESGQMCLDYDDDLSWYVFEMYGAGFDIKDIYDHLYGLYGSLVPFNMVRHITDDMEPPAMAWQRQALDPVYPIIFLDSITYKVCHDTQTIKQILFTVLGISMTGYKDVLGMWLTERIEDNFWTGILHDLKNCGVQNILIACHDHLDGFSDALAAAYPHARQQPCLIHPIRRVTKYMTSKDRAAVTSDAKRIYVAPSLKEAEQQLAVLREKWGDKYPQILKFPEVKLVELAEYFQYPPQIRSLICATNTVEGFYHQLCKFTESQRLYLTEEDLRGMIYTVIRGDITLHWTTPLRGWGRVKIQLIKFFSEELFC